MSDLTGNSFGRYHIFEQLGEGGMAVVYRARDERLKRDVAIKFIKRDQIPPSKVDMVLKRFEREAVAVASFDHPNIVGVFDYGEYEGAPYLVMQYISGGTLADRMGAAVPHAEAVRLLLPVARSLAYAHAREVVHRDVKPTNILVTEDGTLKLSDFGIARLLEGDDAITLTRTGTSVGTPAYMAPEQSMGKVSDQRADIYSLGIVFYELLTGQRPFKGDTPMEIIIQHVNTPLPDPKRYAPDLPENVVQVLKRALEKNPSDRYDSMAAFIADLEALASNLKVSAAAARVIDPGVKTYEDITVLEQAVREKQKTSQSQAQRGYGCQSMIKRTWWVALIGVAGLLALAIGLGIAWYDRVDSDQPAVNKAGDPTLTSEMAFAHTPSQTPNVSSTTSVTATVEVTATPSATQPPTATRSPTSVIDISGDWTVELTVRDVVDGVWREEIGAPCSMTSSVTQVMHFSQSADGSLTGFYYFPKVGTLAASEYDFEGWISGNTFSVTSFLEEGCSGAEVVFQGIVEGDTFQGTKTSLSRALGDCCVFVGAISGEKQ
jgi:serine/threonine protein kinase